MLLITNHFNIKHTVSKINLTHNIDMGGQN